MVDAPAVIPVTTPELLMVATDGLLLTQKPPPEASDNVMDVPGQALVAPVMKPAYGIAFTVTVNNTAAEPHAFVTV